MKHILDKNALKWNFYSCWHKGLLLCHWDPVKAGQSPTFIVGLCQYWVIRINVGADVGHSNVFSWFKIKVHIVLHIKLYFKEKYLYEILWVRKRSQHPANSLTTGYMSVVVYFAQNWPQENPARPTTCYCRATTTSGTLFPTLFEQCVGLRSTDFKEAKVVRWDLRFNVLIWEISARNSNRLQVSLQRKHLLLSYLKALSGYEPVVFHSAADRRLSNYGTLLINWLREAESAG